MASLVVLLAAALLSGSHVSQAFSSPLIRGGDLPLWNHSRFAAVARLKGWRLADAASSEANASTETPQKEEKQDKVRGTAHYKYISVCIASLLPCIIIVVQNAKYIQQLFQNLLQQCDRWIVTGSQTCVERAYNIVHQIQSSSLHSQEDTPKALQMMQQAGMPSQNSKHDNNDNTKNDEKKRKELGKTNHRERRQLAQERTEWEQDWESQVDQGRSALSRRASNREKRDVLLGTIGSNLESFAKEKQQLQATINDENSETDNESNIDNNNNNNNNAALLQQEAATKSAELVAMAGKGGKFEGETMGIGGLDDVLGEIKRRIWVPLAAPPTLLQELGISPVRGLLLYGRPGCGKTLLARTVGQILSPARPITVVSGPELMDKYVGSSEKVRLL